MTGSGSAPHKHDRRIERTRGALLDAFVQLIVEKGYDGTTVQEILDRANVGRSTFYEHFTNKEDLLIGGWTLFQLELPEDGLSSHGPIRLPDVTHIFEHTGEYHALYRSLVTSQAAERIFRVAQDDLQTSLERGLARLEKNGRRLPAPPALAARYLAGGLIALLRYWLDSGMAESPAEMNERFQRLAAKGLSD